MSLSEETTADSLLQAILDCNLVRIHSNHFTGPNAKNVLIILDGLSRLPLDRSFNCPFELLRSFYSDGKIIDNYGNEIIFTSVVCFWICLRKNRKKYFSIFWLNFRLPSKTQPNSKFRFDYKKLFIHGFGTTIKDFRIPSMHAIPSLACSMLFLTNAIIGSWRVASCWLQPKDWIPLNLGHI